VVVRAHVPATVVADLTLLRPYAPVDRGAHLVDDIGAAAPADHLYGGLVQVVLVG
jgi:hypothetical protein